ncbi:MAG: VOC family protein [Chloroflexi bacterium]|nr:VOC family protein [Chloroflexota bacterium]
MIKVTAIDHIGFLVNDLEEGAKFFGDLLNLEWRYHESRESDIKSLNSPPGVAVASPLTADGPTARHLASKGEGISAIIFEVENFKEAIEHFKSRGIRQVGPSLFHPGDLHGVMIGLCPAEGALRWRYGTYAGGTMAPLPPFAFRKDKTIRVTSLHHVNFLVKDYEAAGKFFGDLLGFEWRRTGDNVVNNYRGLRSQIGISLIAPLTADGPTARTLDRKGEGISVVMLAVEDAKVAMEHFKSRGIRQVGPGLFHPRDLHGVMIEVTDRPLSEMWARGLPM